MKPIRILHVVTKMDAGGIETLIMNFYRNIDRKKVQFDFLTHREQEGFYDEEIRNLGGKIYNVPPINPFRHNNYIKALNNFFFNHKEYRIVHSHINTYSMYPLREAQKNGIPIRIAHSHTSKVPLDLKTPFRIYTKSKLKKYTTHNFACSEQAAKWLYGKRAIKKDNFKIINNAIDPVEYSYDQSSDQQIRRRMNLEGQFIIGHVGRFTKQKNHLFLLDIFKEVIKQEPNSILMFIGEGELWDAVKRKVEILGLENKVIFTGVRSDVNYLFQAMDIFVLPSLSEGLGNVAIEAQAAGVPTIVSERIPKEAFITNLIKQYSLKNNAKEWANKIFDLKDEKKEDKTQDIINAGFDILDQTKKLQNFYTKIYSTYME